VRSKTLTAAYLLDWAIGDPESLPHPVRIIGKIIEAGESLMRRSDSRPGRQFLAGSALALCVPVGSGFVISMLLRAVRRRSPSIAMGFEVWLAASCLATRNLVDEAHSVLKALETADLPTARKRLSRIVGRDTVALDETEIARAVIETLAESLCDGIIAPLLYLTIGGAPLAVSYKAINTLDSMIGHWDVRYLWFGKTAARLDDAANFIPARIAALLAFLEPGNVTTSWECWWRDGLKHASPNAGQTESAMAGALQVQLGGVNTYEEERVQGPLLGPGFARPTSRHARGR